LLKVTVAVEKLSDHPLASAIVKGGLEKLGNIAISEASGLNAVMGKGVEARREGTTVYIGKGELFKIYKNWCPE